jgi:hypothetical protein
MRENVGGADRRVRMVVGPALVLAGYTWFGGRRGRAAGIATMIVGALLTETVLTKTCPLNAMVGIDTAHQPPPSLRVNGPERGELLASSRNIVD